MSRSNRIARLTALGLLLAGAGSVLGACQSLAGIEDRTYVPAGDAGSDGGPDTGGQPSPQCRDYCTQAQEVCNGILYRTDEACLATCALLPLEGINANSVACRSRQLSNAVQTDEDLELYCANAGPSGNGVCGSSCENLCRLLKGACSEQFPKYADVAAEGDDGTDVCVSKCQGLVDTGLYDSRDSGNYLGDTLQCRIVHATSATVDPVGHCLHADLKSNKCVEDPASEPDCDTFCRLEMAECTEANGFPTYESLTQCKAVCNALPLGTLGDTTENTVGCRMYHSYNSLVDPLHHCSHTSPGGDGHCGSIALPKTGSTGNCESYCLLLEQACKADFDGSFANLEACHADCAKVEGAGPSLGYTTAATGDNVQCRLLHVSRALTDDSECSAALGAAPCN